MNLQHLSLYHIEWQSLRMQLLGKWHTTESIQESMFSLFRYVETARETDTQSMRLTRAYQVINLLDAVRVGYHGLGIEGCAYDKAVERGYEFFRDVYHSVRITTKPANFIVPTEQEIKEDCAIIGKARSAEILANLYSRKRFNMHKVKYVGAGAEAKEAIVRKNHPELIWAIEAMEKALTPTPRGPR